MTVTATYVQERLIDMARTPAYMRPQSREYVHMFWRPLLGAIAFDVWQTLMVLEDAGIWGDSRWVSLTIVSQTLGVGDRYTLTGRAGSATRPAQKGALERLVEAYLIAYETKGSGNGLRYRFDIRRELPMLMPAQVAQLPRMVKGLHKKFEGKMSKRDRGQWEALTSPTLLHPFVLPKGA